MGDVDEAYATLIQYRLMGEETTQDDGSRSVISDNCSARETDANMIICK